MNNKIRNTVLVLFLLTFTIATASAADWVIEGDTVRTDNKTWGELSATPHTLHGPGYAYCNGTMAADYGNMDFVWGFNTTKERPRSIEIYNPRWANTTSTQFFQNVSGIVVCEAACDIGHEYNAIKRAVTYDKCSEWNETTWDCETYETVTQTVCFDSFVQDGSNYTVTWHNAKRKYWTDLTRHIESVNHNWQGMNKWYYIRDVPMPANETKTVRIWIDMPVTLGTGADTKFFFAAKRTTDTIQEAIAADRFMALDPWHNASRSHRKTVNVTHVNASGSDLTNFTVFLNVSKETEMQADFDDLLFYETDGTAMSFEYENHTADYGLFWVRVPTLTAASETQFEMYYGNAAATSASNPESTWNAAYKMVQLLQEAPANGTAGHLDSTSNDNDGTPEGFDGTATSTTDGTGKIDGADTFDGSSDYVDCGSGASLDITDAITVEAWVKTNTSTILMGRTQLGSYWCDIWGDTLRMGFTDNGVWNAGHISYSYSSIDAATNEWVYVVGTYDNSVSFAINMYIDGENVTIIGEDDAGVIHNTGSFRIGTHGGSLVNFFNGTIDDVRISDTARSADWINQSYQMVANQGTYVTWGAAENAILQIGNATNIKEDWGRDFNSNLSANVTVTNASGVWMNFTNVEFTNTSLGWVNLTLNEWVNESHNVNAPVTNVSVSVFLNASEATNDTDSFYYEITNRTNTATMDSSATQNVITSENFYVNATCNEEYSDTFLGAANLLEDGAIVATNSSVTNYVNFSHSEAVAGVYNYTIRFYNLTHYDNATTPTYSNVTVSGDCTPPDPTTLQNTTGNFWINHTWNNGTGNVTNSYNVSVNLTWYNTTTNEYYNNTPLSAHKWSNVSVWAYNSSANGTLSVGSISQNTQIPNNVPVLSGLPDNTTTENVSQTDIFDLDDYFTDVDGDTPTYLVESNNQSGNVSVTINASNNVSYTLTSGWNGTASVVINVTDGWGGEDNDTFLIIVNPPGDYIPPNPTSLANTTGNGWVNYTWSAGAGNVTDSYNVSWNSTWYNTTLVTYMNDTVGYFGWANITVYAFNASGNGTLSAGNVTDDTQAKGDVFTTNMTIGVWNLISYYDAVNGSAEQFGIDISSVDYVAKYNGSFYTHTMGHVGNNFTTVHGTSYYIFLNASGSTTYDRTAILDSGYNTAIYNRWNTIGWTNSTNTNANSVVTAIGSNCTYISKLNTDGITHISYTKGFVTNNFAVARGYGYWTWSANDSTWSRNS